MTQANSRKSSQRLLVAVGSRPDQVCSIGAFARLEAEALKQEFNSVSLLEPKMSGEYPVQDCEMTFDRVLVHFPALHDRRKPWNPFITLFWLKKKNRGAKFYQVVHEFSEAPAHWRLRQAILARLFDGVICNTVLDGTALKRFARNLVVIPLAPVLSARNLTTENIDQMLELSRARVAKKFGLNERKKWLVCPGLITPGKGLEFFKDLLADHRFDGELILMGSHGPSLEDKNYADEIKHRLKELGGACVHFIMAPSDGDFSDIQFAADLVALPFENGVSERRSSWLAAMATGCNIWTTTSALSAPLLPELKTCWVSSLNLDSTSDRITKILSALAEPRPKSIHRRLENLRVVAYRGWPQRALLLRKFISEA